MQYIDCEDEAYSSQEKDFKPKKFVLTTVKIFDNEGNEIRHHVRDYGKRKTKEWLCGVIMWALCEGYRIEINRKIQ